MSVLFESNSADTDSEDSQNYEHENYLQVIEYVASSS
jgi:hypothetical protein